VSLHERIALALGWTVVEAQSFSLTTLRDFLRPVAPSLADEITTHIRTGGHLTCVMFPRKQGVEGAYRS
jgi:hypothetical protein